MTPVPAMPHRVTLKTPGTSRIDPQTRNELPGDAVELTTRAYLAARPARQLRSQFELTASQDTTVSMFDLLLPAGTPIDARTRVYDEEGLAYTLVGRPAPRPHRNPTYIAATVRLISDLQR